MHRQKKTGDEYLDASDRSIAQCLSFAAQPSTYSSSWVFLTSVEFVDRLIVALVVFIGLLTIWRDNAIGAYSREGLRQLSYKLEV